MKYYKTHKCHGVHTRFNKNSVDSRFICDSQRQGRTLITIMHAERFCVIVTTYY